MLGGPAFLAHSGFTPPIKKLTAGTAERMQFSAIPAVSGSTLLVPLASAGELSTSEFNYSDVLAGG